MRFNEIYKKTAINGHTRKKTKLGRELTRTAKSYSRAFSELIRGVLRASRVIYFWFSSFSKKKEAKKKIH